MHTLYHTAVCIDAAHITAHPPATQMFRHLLQATTEVLTMFEDLLGSLDEAERGKLQRSMGMKMEQLKVTTPMLLGLSLQPAGLLLCALTGCSCF